MALRADHEDPAGSSISTYSDILRPFAKVTRMSTIDTWQQALPHGITLSCRACGERGRPVLMFLHGFPEGAFVWDELLAHFACPENGGYRCVAPNLRGFEQSSAPTDVSAYRGKPLVQDIAALIDSECGPGGTLAALIAHDWGGALAWSLASQWPHKLQQLVIINSPHPGPFARELQHNPAQQAASAYMNSLVRPDAAQRLSANRFEKLLGFLRGHDDELHSQNAASASPAWLTEKVAERYRQLWQQGLEGGLNYYRATPLRPGLPPLEIDPQALRVDVPTLVLWAQDDIALLPCLTEGLQAFVPEMKLVPIAGATHWVVHEQPQRVISEISGFLKAQ